jgi:hypothetical protein
LPFTYCYIRSMFIKKVLFLLFISVAYNNSGYGQTENFCDAVTTIVRDAPNQFRNIKGKFRSSDATAAIWDCGIKVPGTIGSRFVSSMGLFYEGAFFQANTVTQLPAYYEKVKQGLLQCLTPLGYKMTLSDNFSPGLSGYKKVVFMLEPKDDKPTAKPPAHVTLEALYNKDINKYTVVMYIFEN